jgi:replicative DNA helicase
MTYTPPLPIDELKATYYSICNKEEKQLIDSGNEDLNEFINKQDIGEIVKNIQNEKVKDAFLQGIAQYSGDDEMISSFDIVEKMKKEGPMEKFMTTWSALDSLTGGFTPGQLIVLSAPTKNGKTTFSMDMTRRMKEYAPAWFPFEEGPQELITKYLERNEEPPLFFTPKAIIDNHLDWVERKIVESLIKYNSRIFFVDHLHFVVPPNSQNMSQQIGQTMRRLKGIAKTWNVVIVLIAHLKKTRMDGMPNLDDLRDSSFIGQEPDTVFIMWRKAKR